MRGCGEVDGYISFSLTMVSLSSVKENNISLLPIIF